MIMSPMYINLRMVQEVQYSREGNSKGNVPANTLAVFRFVKEAFVIPNNFEKDHKVIPVMMVLCVSFCVYLCVVCFCRIYTIWSFLLCIYVSSTKNKKLVHPYKSNVKSVLQAKKRVQKF